MRRKSNARLSVGLAMVVAVAALVVARPGAVHADGELAVSVVGGIDAGAYPQMHASLTAVDGANGQALTSLGAPDVSLSDDAGPIAVTSVTAHTSADLPTAYVLLFDTSGGMQAYLSRAQQLARDFVAKLGPRDVVRVVSFNTGTDQHLANWWLPGDPNLVAAINGITLSANVALVNDAMTQSTVIANTAPKEVTRKAVVAFLTVDGARAERQLSADEVKNRFPPTTFVFGFGTPPADDPGLPQFLDSLGKYSGGGYWLFGSPSYPADPNAAILDVTRRAWDVAFTASGLPDAKQHPLTVAIKTPDQRSGSATVNYTSGKLLAVTPLGVQGLKDGDSVDADRDVAFAAGGQKSWTSVGIEVFNDCDPGACAAAATSTTGTLSWKLIASPLSQGSHRLSVRVTASDGQRQFSDTQVIRYERSGTSFNLGVLALFLGVGLVAVAGTAIVIRRRPPAGW